MKLDIQKRVYRNSAFVFVAIASILLLSIPAVAMAISNEVNWGKEDFIAMFALLFGTGSSFVLALRWFASRRGRAIALFVITSLFLYVWTELSVGVFTKLGA